MDHQHQNQQPAATKTEYNDTTNMPTHPPPIHNDNAPPDYHAADLGPQANQYGGGMMDQQAMRIPPNGVDKAYNRVAFYTLFRWICAVVLIALSAVILKDGPSNLLKIAAAYSIAAGAVQIPFFGYPRMGPRSPVDARPPKWFGYMLAFTSIVWIPSFALMFRCYVKGDNYAIDDEDDYDYDSYDGLWKRRFIYIGGWGSDDFSSPISKLALGAGVVGVIGFLMSLVVWSHAAGLKRQVWDENTISTVYYRTRKHKQEQTTQV